MRPSRQILILVLWLTLFGLIMVGTSSLVDAARTFGDKWYYVKLQAAWAVAGIGSLLFFSRFDHRHLQKYAVWLMGFSLLLLVLVLIPGIGVKIMGARRWIDIGISFLQPSEIAKLCGGIYFASLLTKPNREGPFAAVLLLVSGLIMLEPDLGTTLVFVGMGFILYFGSGGRLGYLGLISVVGLIGVTLLIAVSPYRLNRLKSYFNISQDPLGSSYQIRQALIALGSGGILGEGLGQSRQKYTFLPETTTDSIFAIIGEELGLFGTVGILVCYLLLLNLGLRTALSAKVKFSANLAIALTALLGFQAFINISAITALVPLTGIPLTFISYGGSSLVMMLSAAGMLININRVNEHRL